MSNCANALPLTNLIAILGLFAAAGWVAWLFRPGAAGNEIETDTHSICRDEDGVLIDYTNWQGERRSRRVIPTGLRFMATEHHTIPQWILLAIDMEKSAARAFALKNIHNPEALHLEVY
jgi:hypothetical protein